MNPVVLPASGTPLAWLVADDTCPEFAEVHWGYVLNPVGSSEVEILDETTDEVCIYHYKRVLPWIVPGYGPKQQRSVWD